MSPSAAPKRASTTDDTSANKAQKRRRKVTGPRDAADDTSFQKNPKRRRLNDESNAAPAKRAPHRPLGPRNSNQNITAGPSPDKKSSAPPRKTPTSPKALKRVEAPSRPRASPATKTSRFQPHQDDARSLRSQDAARPKSDLSKYFPDFEDVIRGEAEEDEFFAPETVLHICDRDTKTSGLPLSSPTSSPNIKRKRQPVDSGGPSSPVKTKRIQPKKKQLDLVALAREWEQSTDDPDRDPLSDDLYRPHRRAERQEKQARNTDKERAMHEKSELQRLLGDLRGPDWLRTLGISGITETQKRALEPKRDVFISRVQGLLDRFASWKEREKELKLRREKKLQRLEEGVEDDASATNEEYQEHGGETADEQSSEPEDAQSDHSLSSSRSSVDDDSASQPMQNPPKSNQSTSRGKNATCKGKPDTSDAEDPTFKSFFVKKHQRAAAMEKHRRGRHTSAFGYPIPEMEQASFELPDTVVGNTRSAAAARRRKRVKEEKPANE